MEPNRLGVLVLGAIAITSTTMLFATRRDEPTEEAERTLAASTGQAIADSTDLAALGQSIDRLIDLMEQEADDRREGASPGPPRQPVGASDDSNVADLLQKQNELLLEIRAAMLARAGTIPPPDEGALRLRATVASGPRPTNVNAWADYLARYPPDENQEVPLELAVLGVAELLERFGWPKQVRTPSQADHFWYLLYQDVDVPIANGVVTHIHVTCNRDGTYRLWANRK
jgi:hypothetical protein